LLFKLGRNNSMPTISSFSNLFSFKSLGNPRKTEDTTCRSELDYKLSKLMIYWEKNNIKGRTENVPYASKKVLPENKCREIIGCVHILSYLYKKNTG